MRANTYHGTKFTKTYKIIMILVPESDIRRKINTNQNIFNKIRVEVLNKMHEK